LIYKSRAPRREREQKGDNEMTHHTFQSAISEIQEDLADGSTQELAQYLADLMSYNAAEYQSGEGLREAFNTYIESLANDIDLSAVDEDRLFEESLELLWAKKHWVADDGQASLGEWEITTSDAEIWAELKEQGHDLTGKIEIG
jgi:hypothetical protein